MSNPRRWFASVRRFPALLALAVVFGSAAAAAAPAAVDPVVQVREMRRGVNILGYDPFWRAGGKARFQARHFEAIRKGGFDHVRVNLQAFAHMDAQNRLEPQWLTKLDGVVDTATKTGLTVILDEHDFNSCGQDPQACRPKLVAFWRQVAERYRDAPSSVVFELLNEPNRKLDPQWNALAAELLAVVRATNPTRNVIVGPAFWNNVDWLDRLQLPADDRHIIVTVHYYLPMEFTHQGAPWNPDTPKLGVTWGTPAERQRLERDFDRVQAWSQANRRPILLGEFGAYDKGEMASRARYTAAVARAAEARGWAWSYWQFDSDFIVYDIGKDQWVAPIHDALVPR